MTPAPMNAEPMTAERLAEIRTRLTRAWLDKRSSIPRAMGDELLAEVERLRASLQPASERPAQPEQLVEGQLWRSRKSGGVVRIAPQQRWTRSIEWVRVSGRGAHTGWCHASTLRSNYDYVGEADR